MTGFRLHDPWWLLALIPLGLLALRAAQRRRVAAVLYSEVSLLALLPKTAAQRGRRLLPWVRGAGFALLVGALARPQCGQEEFRVRAEGIAILMCLDRSGSMQEPLTVGETRTSRLEVARRAFRDFVTGGGALPGRPDDRIGLIAFTGFVEDKCPLTLDHHALLRILDTVQITPPPADPSESEDPRWSEDRLTAIGDAVTAAIDRLKDAEAKSRVVILLSDGQQTAGVVAPSEAARAAQALGIKLYTISLQHDPGVLREMAQATGGRCFAATDAQALDDVYAEIDRLEKSPTLGRLYTQYHELFPYLMFPGLGSILLVVVLSSTRLRALP